MMQAHILTSPGEKEAVTMSGSDQQPDSPTDLGHNQDKRHEPPYVVAATWDGEVGVVDARSGRECWILRTGCQLGTTAIDGESVYFATDITLATMKRLQNSRDLDPERRTRLMAQANIPAQLQARRASDGTQLWTHTHPKINGRLHVEAERGIVVAANPRHFEAETSPLQAFDGATGNLIWEMAGTDSQWRSDRLVAVRGGRVYTRPDGRMNQNITVLDLRTGKPLWQRTFQNYWSFSPGGNLIAEQLPDRTMLLLDASSGAEMARISLPLPGIIVLLSDDSIVYQATDLGTQSESITALDARTGRQLWALPGIWANALAHDDGILCYACVLSEQRIAEVVALDAATGEQLWQWRSPASLTELLRLWGARRTPVMLWDSSAKSFETVRSIVGQRWFRLRTPRWPPRLAQRKMTTAMRLRGIREGIAGNVVWPLWNELSHGHWRHPWQLHDGINVSSLAMRGNTIFLATWLGLFALDATSGRLL